MANKNSYDSFLAANKQRLKDLDVMIECSVAMESVEPITKILSVNVEGNCTQIEALTKEANINGNILINIVYLTEQGLVGNSQYSSVFNGKIIDDIITPSSIINAKIIETEAKVQSLNSNIAKVNCSIKLGAYCLNNNEIKYLNNVSDDICLLEDENNFESFVGNKEYSFSEEIMVEVKESINKVLSTNSSVNLKDAKNEDGFCSLYGEILNRIMYVTNDETPVVKTAYYKQEFKQDVELDILKKDYKTDTFIEVVKNDVKCSIVEKDEKLTLNLDVPLKVNINVFEDKTISLITDLYSVDSLTETTSSSYNNTIICEPICFEKKIEGSLQLSLDEPRIDKLLACNHSKVTVTNEYLEDGKYNISGIITSNLIYFNDDENNINSLDVEFPFVIACNTDFEGDTLTDLCIVVDDVDVLVKKGRDVYIDANLKVRCSVCRKVTGVVISELKYSEQVPYKDCAIEIYFAKKGEKIWDIAKKLYVKPEIIYSQNTNIKEVLEQDEKLAIYYQKNSME